MGDLRFMSNFKKELIYLSEMEQKIKETKKIHYDYINRKTHPTSDERIAIIITNDCDFGCDNCHALASQAPSTDYMDVLQIEKVLDDFDKFNKEWKRILIYGGEPTLHPQLDKIIDIFESYHKRHDSTEIMLRSHGQKNSKKIINRLPEWIVVRDYEQGFKKHRVKTHRPMTIAPCDLEEHQNANFSIGCRLSTKCCRAVLGNEYFPCSPGAHINRVAGLDIGEKDVYKGIFGEMIEKKKILCRLCGLFVYHPYPYPKDVSSTWRKILDDYNKK